MPGKWEEPIYNYSLPSRKIVINVTRSCPSFKNPAPGVADVAAELAKHGMTRVLDFGAGKLRNTLFLLRHAAPFQVWSVEYKYCLETQAGLERRAEAERYRGFFFLEYPAPFIGLDFEVDAVFFVNVANVVPDDNDRRLMLRECTRRLRKGGWFLWLSQYGEPHYKPGVTQRLKVSDGWAYSLNKEYQTFYKEFRIPDIESYFSGRQYRQIRKVTAAHHRGFLFEKR